MHEATRVYSDKLVDAADNESFAKLVGDVIRKNVEVRFCHIKTSKIIYYDVVIILFIHIVHHWMDCSLSFLYLSIHQRSYSLVFLHTSYTSLVNII